MRMRRPWQRQRKKEGPSGRTSKRDMCRLEGVEGGKIVKKLPKKLHSAGCEAIAWETSERGFM